MYHNYTDVKINLYFRSIMFTIQNHIQQLKQMKKAVAPDFITGSSRELHQSRSR